MRPAVMKTMIRVEDIPILRFIAIEYSTGCQYLDQFWIFRSLKYAKVRQSDRNGRASPGSWRIDDACTYLKRFVSRVRRCYNRAGIAGTARAAPAKPQLS